MRQFRDYSASAPAVENAPQLMSDQPTVDRSPDVERAGGSAAFSPLYQQIKVLLLQGLDRGEWKPGEAIPSELELAARDRKEHTSELQSRENLVCRLLLEKKKKYI